MQAATRQAAATQQLYEYYEQLLDQTAEHPVEKPAVRAADPLQVTTLDEEDPKAVVAAPKKTELKPVVETQELQQISPDEDDVSESESDLQAQIDKADAELASSDNNEPEQQMLATVGEQDEDEKQLAIHEQSLKVLQQMLQQTQLAAKQTKHRLMVKAIAKEVMTQIHSLQATQTRQLSSPSDETTQQLLEDNSAKESALHEEIASLEKPTTEELYEVNRANEEDLYSEIKALSKPQEQSLLELNPADDNAVHTQALGMLKDLITKAKNEIISEEQNKDDSRVLTTADGAQFQALDEDEEEIAQPRNLETSDGVQFQTLDEDDEDIVQPRMKNPELVQSELAAVPDKANKAKAKPKKAAAKKAEPKKAESKVKAPPAVTKPVVAAPKVTVSASSDGKQAEDTLAKKVAQELEPSIGAKLTAQIMRQVEKSIESNEAKLETEIKSAAINAAKSAIDAAPAPAPPAHTEVTTTVEKSPSGVTKTIITKHIVHAPAPKPKVEAKAKKAAATKVIAKALSSPAVDSEIKALEEIAVKKHQVDAALAAKEKSVIAQAKEAAAKPAATPAAAKPAASSTSTTTITTP